MICLELVGPAGAGKSTLSRTLAKRRVTLSTGIWRLPVSRLLLNGVLALPTYFAFRRHSRPLAWEEYKQVVRLRALLQHLRRLAAGSYDLVVLDEGPVFALSWLHVRGQLATDQGSSLLAWQDRMVRQTATLVHAVVVMDAPDPVLAHRIRKRRKPHPVKDKTDQEIYHFSSTFRAAFDRVISDLARERAPGGRGPLVVTLNTAQEPTERVAERLLGALEAVGHEH